MKKKITLTIDAEVVDWMKAEQINISAWVRAIITKKYTENRINKNKHTENRINKNEQNTEKEQDFNEILNAEAV